MNDLEKLQKRVALAQDAYDIVLDASITDRKLSHDKHTSTHYSQALDQLHRNLEGAKNMLKRFETVGK